MDSGPSRSGRPMRLWLPVAMLALVPFVVYLNIWYFDDTENWSISTRLVLLLLGDFVFGLVLVVYFGLLLVRRAVRRMGSSVESPIQLRLSWLFAVVSLFSAVAVAVVATLTMNEGLGGYLRVFISESVDQSRTASQSYFDDEVGKLRTAVVGLAENVAVAYRGLDGDEPLRQLLQTEQDEFEVKVDFAFLIDSACNLRARGNSSYLYDYSPPPRNLMEEFASEVGSETGQGRSCDDEFVGSNPGAGYVERIIQGGTTTGAVYRKEQSNQFSAIHRIDRESNLFLFITNNSIGSILTVHDVLKPGVAGPLDTIQRLGEAIVWSSVVYLVFTLVVVFAMIGLGIAIARRISRPIEELAATASAIEGGVTDVKATVRGDDEVAMLGRAFNQMLDRINSYTDNLIELREVAEVNRELAEKREQSFSSVLSNVSAGVIGLDRQENIVFMNRSAGDLLEIRCDGYNELSADYSPRKIEEVVPEFATMLQALKASSLNRLRREVDVVPGKNLPCRLLVQFAERSGRKGLDGYVVAFDDITEFVKTKERAAWSTAARQIAHEIRNPLYPMLLAVQDMQDLVKDGIMDKHRESFIDYLEMIEQNIKNTDALADSFAEFAKLPEPTLTRGDVCAAVERAVNTELGRGLGIAVSTHFDKPVTETDFDANQLHSVLINLLKNAGEAVAEYQLTGNAPEGWMPQIRVSVSEADGFVEIRVMDNGAGFPSENKEKCLQPFFSTKKEVTRGLGLPYAERVVSGHGGDMVLDEAPRFSKGVDHVGAMVIVRIPSVSGQPELATEG